MASDLARLSAWHRSVYESYDEPEAPECDECGEPMDADVDEWYCGACAMREDDRG